MLANYTTIGEMAQKYGSGTQAGLAGIKICRSAEISAAGTLLLPLERGKKRSNDQSDGRREKSFRYYENNERRVP